MKRASSEKTEAALRQHHDYAQRTTEGRCGSVVTQTVQAPIRVVWSLVRDFGQPQAYKRFVRSCTLQSGNGGVGSEREVRVVSGLPAGVSIERLDRLDEERHVMSFSITGGDHRLRNYRSTTSVHEEEGRTVVVESYAVDVPDGSTGDDTCSFADTIIRCNLMALASIAQKMNVVDDGDA